MQFSQLNNDVIFEIFLQFVAIDWDGPFTLMLVCSKWSNLVLSKPRVWTWIMVNKTQVEWREKMEVSAHLSRNLPLQIVLRTPFESQVLLSHITRRCTSLFLDSTYLDSLRLFTYPRSWARTIISHEEFTAYSAELKQSNDSLSNFLKGVPIQDIQIRSEGRWHTSFACSTWHVYDRLNQRASVQEVLISGETFTITALIFKHSEDAPLPRIQVLVTELWIVLPLLSNLCYLELADDYIEVPKNTVLARIHLQSLHTLKIESPMTGFVFFSLQDDVWLGLLSLLDTIIAPNLEELSLHGPLHRIIAATIKARGRFHLLQLNITISVFDEMVGQEQLDDNSVWHGLRRCTFNIPEQNKARPHTDSEVVGGLRLLFNLTPRHCSVQLHGGAILEPIIQSDLLMDVELHIVTRIAFPGDLHKPLRWPRKIMSLSLTGEPPEGLARVPWISSVEKLWTGMDWTIIYPNGSSLPMRVMECGYSTEFLQDIDFPSDDVRRGSFSNLTDLTCDEDLVVGMITDYDTPRLRSLILLDPVRLSKVCDVLEKASHRLLLLDTLGLYAPDWCYLLPFVASFNRSRGRGIFTVKFTHLPHPAILHHLGRALRGDADQPDILLDLFNKQESQMERRYPSGCYYCKSFGWSCYGKGHCSREFSEDMMAITGDMPLTKYEGDWGPDGQGWDDNPINSDESRMDIEHESAGVTSETSVE